MRAVVQRVREARVIVDAKTVGSIGPGLLVLAGVSPADADGDRDWLARKIVTLRIFDDDAGVMNRSITEVAGEILVAGPRQVQRSSPPSRPTPVACGEVRFRADEAEQFRGAVVV